jgi:CMP-N-acetylneuraminic acid synthetase
MTQVLGMIPAKGGSTRLPRKNILPLGGKHMLLWAADALKKSGICDRVIVSTEDDEIASICKKYDLEVPFLRPMDLAKDPAGVVQVALHCLDVLRQQGDVYDILVISLPTCPFVTPDDFKNAFSLFIQRKADFLMSVSKYEHSPFLALKYDHDIVTPYFPEYSGKKSQALPDAYRPNGGIHILNVEAFQKTKSYYSQPLCAYKMPWPRGVDIDTIEDFIIAEELLKSGIVEGARDGYCPPSI